MLKFHIDKYFEDGKVFGDIALIQIGRLLPSGELFHSPHPQYDYYELTLVTSGNGVISCDGVGTKVKEGDIYISLPNEIHDIYSDNKSKMEFDFFTFRILEPELAKKMSDIALKRKSPDLRVIKDKNIFFLVDNAILEIEKEEKQNNYDILCSLIKSIVLYLIRDLSDIKTENGYLINNDNNICYRIMNYIDINIYSIKSLSEISTVANYNYSYLSTLFKKTTGRTIEQYYINKRLQTAKFLLLEKKFSPTEIAEKLGYTSYFSFSRSFKQKYGLSPKQFKENN